MDLSRDFTETTLKLTADAEGPNTATLISSNKNQGNRDAVLYLHGFIDYFFHPHVAAAFHENNMDFYALDLRKYGRSILPHQTPNYCDDVSEYYEEISYALGLMQQKTNKKLFILAHSTGCTIASMYLNQGEKRHAVSGLILNSPFLEMPQSKAKTKVMYHVGKQLIKIKPKTKLPRAVNSVYPKGLHASFSGEWHFDLTKKPIEGFDGYFEWAIAIVNAQHFLQNKSDIKVPVLTLHAQKSYHAKQLNTKSKQADIILNVAHMKKYAPKLGKNVTLVSVKNGVHDLFLSEKPVRKKALSDMFLWLNDVRNQRN